MIIFGWGHQSIKNYGVVFKNKCSYCNNEDYWQLIKSTTWFTLFFIPVIPYSIKYMLICPVCERGVKLDSGQAYEYRNIAEANTDLINQKITTEEYHARIGATPKEEQKVIEANVADKEKEQEFIKKDTNDIKVFETKKYCSNCGNSLEQDSAFCSQCGIKV